MRIIERIESEGRDQGFRAIDLSGNSINLLTYLEPATEHILIVDSARMGEAPGAVRFFRADEVETKKELSGLTTHESDLLKILELARMTGHHIPPITFMGIEPASTDNRTGLSAIIEQRLSEYVTTAVARCLAG